MKMLDKGKTEFLKNKNKWLIIIGFVGIGLIFLSSLFPSGNQNRKSDQKEQQSLCDYEKQLEDKIEDTICKISGAGKCKVVITFDQGIEYIYAKEEKNTDDKSLTSKTDEYAEGSKKSGENEYIIIDTENGEQALLITEKAPKVRGVVVVCEGGGNPSVAATVKRAVTVALDISESKVCVSPKA